MEWKEINILEHVERNRPSAASRDAELPVAPEAVPGSHTQPRPDL